MKINICEYKIKDFYYIRKYIKLNKYTIFLFILRVLVAIMFLPAIVYSICDIVTAILNSHIININNYILQNIMLFLKPMLTGTVLILYWFRTNMRALNYTFTLDLYAKLSKGDKSICPRCGSEFKPHYFTEKEKVLVGYNKKEYERYEYLKTGDCIKHKEIESTPEYLDIDIDRQHFVCSNSNCGFQEKKPRGQDEAMYWFHEMPFKISETKKYITDIYSNNGVFYGRAFFKLRPPLIINIIFSILFILIMDYLKFFPTNDFYFIKNYLIQTSILCISVLLFSFIVQFFSHLKYYSTPEEDISEFLEKGQIKVDTHLQNYYDSSNFCSPKIKESNDLNEILTSQNHCKNDVPYDEKKSLIKEDYMMDFDISSKIFQGSLNPENDLKELIGLDAVKEELLNIICECEFDKKRSEQGIPQENDNGNHILFLGSAGTGKTTVARIMTGILYKYGYIKENKIIDINATELTGEYVGQTKQKVKKYIEAAKGGVLFLDEAYVLNSRNRAGGGNIYNEEATSVLVKAMEDNRNDFIVIAAGYKNPTLNWVASNEGLNSRFTKKIVFPDYSVDECVKIFKMIAEKHHFQCTTEFLEYYRKYIMNIKDVKNIDYSLIGGNRVQTFSNARQIRNDFKNIKTFHSRYYKTYNYAEDILNIFVIEDAKHLDTLFADYTGVKGEYLRDNSRINFHKSETNYD